MDLFSTVQRMRAKRNAELPPELRIAKHIVCMVEDDGFTCTCEAGHTGDHVAHSSLGGICHRWPQANYPVPAIIYVPVLETACLWEYIGMADDIRSSYPTYYRLVKVW